MRYIISLALTSLLATPAAAEVPKVVTDIHAVQSLVAEVMGELGSPTVLLDRGADEHSFQLRPSQAASLASADLVVWIGPELTPWLDRPLDSLSGDIARLGLLALPGTHLQDYGAQGAEGHDEGGHDHGHDHDHDHAAEAGHDHDHGDGHDHSGTDPHAWLDPANARHWLTAIAEELSRIDPANAATYAANAGAASDRIAALDAELAARLEPVQDRPFFVFHDAFGYFAGHFGLTVAGSIAAGDAANPGAAHLADLRDMARAGGAVCIFPEPQHDAALAQRIAEDTGLRMGGALDPSGSTLEPGPALYPALLTGLADTILACLQE